ncbi:MAG TPA: heterodisulfide reductase-related iron-sulfur binding cluster [Gemmatimonadales bacterium]|nr:heterodisulfide reductase-related iron-sulfur binding cluster [Gemmatimonadales bacterium]
MQAETSPEARARGGFAALDTCVHCGFCLQACPTFLATGDEADSPRGRIELMRGLERGELSPSDPFVQTHLDRCLGCRACEPVCPSGVGYGHGLEEARAMLARTRRLPWTARLALAAFTTPGLSRFVYGLARMLRWTGVPRLLAGWGRFGFAMGMLAATRDGRGRSKTGKDGPNRSASTALARPRPSLTVLLFRGCIMDGLFSHVHDATIRTLQVNGYDVREVADQACCGALHVHAGLHAPAAALARRNAKAFGDGTEPIVVNSAGCGALLKEYAHLLDDGGRFGKRVRDVTELLAERGPVPGAPVDRRVAYDPPCHLLHAQRIADPPLALFKAIPVMQLVSTPDAAQCCGSAGIYSLLEPEMSRAVLGPKLASLREAAPAIVATGNPGCLMQLGAGLRAAGLAASVRHPVELLDDSYRAAGLYA